jgi:hypothetical protein
MNPGGRLRAIRAESWLTLVFTLLTAAMLVASFWLSRPSAWVPRVVLCVTLPLLLWQLIRELRSPGMDGKAEVSGARALAASAWICLLPVLAWLLGAAAGSAVFCAAWLRWHAAERWLSSLAIAAALGLSIWLLFGVFLGVELYVGIIPASFG